MEAALKGVFNRVLKNLRKASAQLGKRRKSGKPSRKMLAFHSGKPSRQKCSPSNRELPDIRSGLPCSGARVKTSSTTTPGTPSEPPPSRDSRSICDGWRPKPRHDRRPRVPAHRLRVRTSPPNRSNCPRWRASEDCSARAGCSRAVPSRCVIADTRTPS